MKPKSRVAPLLNAALSPTTPSIDKVIPDDPYLHDGNSPGLIPPNHSIHSPLIQRRPQHVDHFTAAELEYRNEIRSLEQRRSIKRLNAIKELMETEETYSRDLNILCTVSVLFIQLIS